MLELHQNLQLLDYPEKIIYLVYTLAYFAAMLVHNKTIYRCYIWGLCYSTFQPSIMFVSKAEAYPSEAPLRL
jgi:hypothetical protein